MTIRVKLFAIVREKTGQSRLSMDLAAGTSVQLAAAALAKQFPAIEPDLRRSAFAVNQSYAPADTILNDGDELAVIPPVSGG